ncbi:MAG: hypothetical protein NVSMB57_17370 [Actinomycetota bacterium]
MKRSLIASFALAAALSGALPAHAGGGLGGYGSVPSGTCKGGELAIGGVNTSGANWIFNVTLGCTSSTPQYVTVAGTWDADMGGTVIGFSTGSLIVGKVPCGSSSNVPVQISMIASPVVTAKASITRYCD